MESSSATEALLSRCSAASEPLLPFNLSLPGENEEALLGLGGRDVAGGPS